MVRKTYSVRDSKAEVYHLPFYVNTDAEAVRTFRTAVNDERTTFNKNPEDFDLMYLGEYNDETGQYDQPDTPRCVTKGLYEKQDKPAIQYISPPAE